MVRVNPIISLVVVLTGYIVSSGSDRCVYDDAKPSAYVQCSSISQRPPYSCESNGGRGDDPYQIHILETDLDRVDNYNSSTPPEIVVVIKPLSNIDTTRTIVLVFHAFKKVTWRLYTEMFSTNTKFIIKTSYPLIIDPTSILAKSTVDLMYTLPKDSEAVIRTIESLYGQRVTSFNGFHQGTRINWFIGPSNPDSTICTIMPYRITEHVQIWKEIPVDTTGCTVSNSHGYSTHIIDVDKTHESGFPFAKHFATLIVKSKSNSGQEFFGSNIMLILRSKIKIEWTIDTSGMDGIVMVVTNGILVTPAQANLKIEALAEDGFDLSPQDFINYVATPYGMVASYTKVTIANHFIIELPEVTIAQNGGNTTDQPQTEALPDLAEILASIDGQKTLNCYRDEATVSWSVSLLDSLHVENIYFMGYIFDACSLQIEGTQMSLVSTYDKCGFMAENGPYSSVYETSLVIMLTDGRTSQLDIQCQIYNTSKIEAVPKDNLYYLSIYDDADYTTKLTEFSVPNNGYVYFKADLKTITDPNMSAIVEECFLSPTKDNILDRHVLISHTCPLDNSIHFINQNYIGMREEKSQKIKFKVSRYFIYSNDYYLHCKVSMCSRIVTPDIPMCSVLYNMCKRNPPDSPMEKMTPGFEREYILAGPIFIHNNTAPDTPNNSTLEQPCNDGVGRPNRPNDKFDIGVGLLIGIALGSFAIGIILTVFIVHCVTISRKRCKHQPTDVYRFENRNESTNMYEPIKVYDVCPQGHHLNRTTQSSAPPRDCSA